jgi:hypothetical protein
MKPRGGFSLIGVLWFVGLLLTISLASAAAIETARGHVMAHKYVQQAGAMADCGLTYARGAIRAGRWHGHARFESPRLDNQGWFVVDARQNGGAWSIISTGCAGSARVRRSGGAS